jgi:hypothetical protein
MPAMIAPFAPAPDWTVSPEWKSATWTREGPASRPKTRPATGPAHAATIIPPIPEGTKPTRHAEGIVGQSVTHIQYGPEGTRSLRTIEVLGGDREYIHVRQTVKNDYGSYSSKIRYNRHTDGENEHENDAKFLGTEKVGINGSDLYCRVLEQQLPGGGMTRTLLSDEVFGKVVIYSEKIGGKWVKLLELTSFTNGHDESR